MQAWVLRHLPVRTTSLVWDVSTKGLTFDFSWVSLFEGRRAESSLFLAFYGTGVFWVGLPQIVISSTQNLDWTFSCFFIIRWDSVKHISATAPRSLDLKSAGRIGASDPKSNAHSGLKVCVTIIWSNRLQQSSSNAPIVYPPIGVNVIVNETTHNYKLCGKSEIARGPIGLTKIV
jgi:hypothetical protein